MQTLDIECDRLLFSAQHAYQSGKAYLKEKFHELPDNTFDCAAAGAVLSFAAATILTGSAAFGLTCALTAATASLIDSLVNPFFEKCFGPEGNYSPMGKTIKNVVCVLIAGAVVSTVTGTPIPLVISIIGLAAYNILFPQNEHGWDSHSSSVYFVI